MNRNVFKKFSSGFFAFSTTILLLLSSCGENSGLGATIDTESPVLTIAYPPASSAVRGTFYLAGTCTDDKAVTRVEVSVTNLDTQKNYGTYPAEIDHLAETWKISLNKEDTLNPKYFNGWEYPDGNYKFDVTAYDAAGHSSGTSSQSFDIDNTPPVFVISKPGVVRSDTLEDSAKISKYGSIFTIEGTISESHLVSSMEVLIYDENGTLINTEPYSEEEIPTTGSSSVTIARYLENGTDKENTRYAEIYGSDVEAGDKIYSCTVTLSDSAKVYQNPEEKEAGSGSGNSTTTVYLYDDVYVKYLSRTKGAGLSVNNFRAVLNGTAKESDFVNKGVKPTTISELSDALYSLAKRTSSAKDSSLSFSLNPKADPTYTVSGLSFYYNDDGTNAASDTKTAIAEQSIMVSVSAGFDGVKIKPSALKVWIKSIGDKDNGIFSKAKLEEDIASLVARVKAAESNEDDTLEAVEKDTGWALLLDNSSDTAPSDSLINLSMETPDSITLNNAYIIVTTGKDMDDVYLSQKQLYGFIGNVAGQAPTITIDSPVNNEYFATSGYVEDSETDRLVFKGIAYENTNNTFIKEIKAEITVSNAETNDVLGTLSAAIEGSKEKTFTSAAGFSCELNSETQKYDWILIPSQIEGYEEVKAEKDSKLYYMYTLKLTITGSTGHESSIERSVYIDTTPPEVIINSITPYVLGSEYYGSEDTNTYLNGTAYIKGNVDEKQKPGEVVYNVFAKRAGTDEEFISLLSILSALGVKDADGNLLDGSFGVVSTINRGFDTNLITKYFATEKEPDPAIEIELTITAFDSVGNSHSYSTKETNDGKNFIIKQETNRPLITLGNAEVETDRNKITQSHNMFGTTSNNKLQFSISDDDSIVEYEVSIKNAEGQSIESIKTPLPGKTTAQVSITLPDEEGEYQLEIKARDFIVTELLTDETNPYGVSTTGLFWVAVDNGAPEFKNVSPADGKAFKENFTVTGTLIDGSGTVLLSADSGESGAESTYKNAQSVTGTAGEGKIFTDTIIIPEADGKYTITYIAKDKYGQESSWQISYIADKTAPLVSNLSASTTGSSSSDSKTYFNSTLPLSFSLVADDGSGTGVAKAEYVAVKGIKDEYSDSDSTIIQVSSLAQDGTNEKNWNGTISGFVTSDIDDGDYTIFAHAIDSVGNKSGWQKLSIVADKTAPVLSYADTNFTKKSDGVDYSYAKDSFEISGTLTETNLESLSYTLNGSEGKSLELDENKSWKISNSEVDAGGEYSYVITASDKAGNKSILKRTFVIDKTPPVVEITALNDKNFTQTNTTKNATCTFEGKASDNENGTGLKKVRAFYKKYNVAQSEESGDAIGEIEINPDATGNWKQPFYSVSEDWYVLHVIAEDEAGNSTEVKQVFGVDSNAPKSTLNVTEAIKAITANEGGTQSVTPLSPEEDYTSLWNKGTTYIASEKFTISGTISDSFKFNTSDIKFTETKQGEQARDFTASVINSTEAGISSINWSFTSPETADLADGIYTYKLSATDNAGNKADYSFIVQVDRTAPTVTVVKPASGENFKPENGGNAASVAISGTAFDDGTGVQEVDYEIKMGEEQIDSGTALVESGKWTANANISKQGHLSIKVTAKDYLDNEKSTDEISFFCDSIPPEFAENLKITTQRKSDFKYYDTTVLTIQAKASDAVSGVGNLTYTLNGGTAKAMSLSSAEGTNEAGQTGTYTASVVFAEGENTIFVTATDTNGNSLNSDSLTVFVDTKAPLFDDSISVTKEVEGQSVDVSSTGSNETVTVKGKISDTYGLASQNAFVVTATKNGTQVTNLANVLSDLPSLGAGSPLESSEWSFKVLAPANHDNDGKWVFTITATDVAGNQSTKSVNVLIDTTAPVWYTDADKNFIVGGKVYATSNWYKVSQTDTLAFSGYFSESASGSGIKIIDYTISPSSSSESAVSGTIIPNSATGYSKFSSELTGFTNGAQIKFTARDEAGNSSSSGNFVINIDTEAPALNHNSIAYKVEDAANSVALWDSEKSTAIPLLSNAKKAISITGTISDQADFSGIDTSSISALIGAISYDADEEADNHTKAFTLTLSKEALSALSDGVHTINGTFRDVAGNSYTDTIATIQIDKADPVVTITSPTASRVNKTITIEGSASDAGGFDYAVIKAVTGTKNGETVTYGDYTELASTKNADGTTNASVYNADTGVWTVELDTFTSDYAPDSTEKPLKIRVTAYDKAGNSKSEEKTYTIAQNDDRPVIKITNLTDLGSSAQDRFVLKYGTKSQVIATVSDDDGIDKVYISETPFTGTETAPTNSEYNTTEGTVTFTPSADATAGKNVDAQKSFYIYVKDSKGTEFYTTYQSKNSVTDYLNIPKVKVNNTDLADSENAAAFTYRSDSSSPTVVDIQALAYKSNGSENGGLKEGTSEYTEYEGVNASYIVGGTEKQQARFKISASDASGIDGIALEITYKDSGNAEHTLKLRSKDSDAIADSTYEVKGTFTEYAKDGATEKTEAAWTTEPIDFSSIPSGNVTIKVIPYDKLGLVGNGNATFLVDNSSPEIAIRTPVSGTEVTGSVEITGTATDQGGAGTANIQWLVPTNDETSAAESEQYKIAYYKGLNWNGGVSSLATGSSASAWQFDFDGKYDTKNSNPDEHKFVAGNPLFAAYDKAAFATNADCATSGVFYLPVYFMATDALGNSSVYTDFFIRHNPDNDKPKVEFTYPTKENYKSASEQYAILGGTIRATGTAEIPSGTTSVRAIYYQIADENAGFTGTYTASESGTDSYKAKNTYGYTIVSAQDVINAIKGSTVSITTDEQAKQFGFATKAALDAWWGIEATGTASWNIKLNGDRELNPPENETTNITLRACGVNADAKFGAWTSGDNLIAIHIDDTAPVIIPAINQYGNGTSALTALPTTTYTSSQTYEDDMYLRGNWTLVATLLDETSVTGYSVFKDGASQALSDVDDYFVEKNVTDTSTNKKGVRLYIPIPKDSESVKFTIEATDTDHSSKQSFEFKIDETAPTLDTLKANGTLFTDAKFSSIEDSNYRFVLSGSSTDEGSGVEHILFYYMRKDKITKDPIGTEIVMDPMITTSPADAKVKMSDLTAREFTQGDKKFYLYAKKYSGTATTDTFTLDETESAYDSHVRRGGVVEIDGILHRISKIEGKTITFTPALAAAKTTSFDAYFPIAQVIDNSATEKVASYSGKDFTFENTSDDGDGMPESFSKSGKTWTWDATIHSTNMSDGPVSLVILAFDNAGNVAEKAINTTITNNAPRLAKVFLGTDLSGDDKFTNSDSLSEIVEYDILGAEGNTQSAYTLDFTAELSDGTAKYQNGVFKIKNGLAVIPEFTGGNGDIGMVLSTTATSATPVAATVSNVLISSDQNITIASENGISTFTGNVAGTFAASSTNTQMHAFTIGAGSLGEDGENKGMSFTFWDSTEETTQGTNSLNAVLYVKNFTIEQGDKLPPTVVVNPFYWKSLKNNSVYGSESASSAADLKGHIELEDDWKTTKAYTDNKAAEESAKNAEYDDDPKVSGKIRFTGTAYDNRRLSKIKIKFGDFIVGESDAEVEIASYELKDSNAASKEMVWKVAEKTMVNNGYEFKVVDKTADSTGNFDDSVYFSQKGHKIYWTLDIDTEQIKTTAATDVKLTVLATDAAGKTTMISKITNAGTDDETTTSCIVPPGIEEGKRKVTDGTTNYPIYQMDVVPYIAGVKTGLSSLKKNNSSVYDRTALGHYPVASTETIYIYGFNLAGGTLCDKQTTPQTAALSEEIEITALTGLKWYAGSAAPTGKVYSVGAISEFTSGEVSVKVGTVESLNNKNNNGAYGKAYEATQSVTSTGSTYKDGNFYNRQPNGDNNNNLTDDVVLDVWGIDSEAGKPKSGPLSQPVMAINPYNKQVGFAFANGPLNFSMGSLGKSYLNWEGGVDFWTSVGFAYDANGNSFGTAAGGDINDQPSADSFAIFTSRWGEGGDTDKYGHNRGQGQLRIELIGQSDSTDGSNWSGNNIHKQRIQSPSIATTVASESATSTNVYLAYYDAINDEIRFKWGIFSNSDKLVRSNDANDLFVDYYGKPDAEGGNDNTKGTVSLTKSKKVIDLPYTLEYVSLIAGQTKDKWTFVPGSGTSSKYTANTAVMTRDNKPVYAGQYVSIAAKYQGGETYNIGTEEEPVNFTDDLVVAVWYDATNNQMLYSYNKAPQKITAPTYKGNNYYRKNNDGTSSGIDSFSQSATGWHKPVAIFGEGNGIGEHCKVVLDSKGKVHIACYDNANADVWYAYISNPEDPDGAKKCIVDSYGIVGTELNIDVALKDEKPVPYISYYGSSCARPKVAYWAGTESIASADDITGADDENFTENWEVSIIPSNSKISIDHINVGVWKDSSGNLIASTKTDGTVGTTSSGNENGTIWGNGTMNPILGYAITKGSGGYIETAQMK
ncbi:Ig-like domain-containing protein [uncultured Treponema sp.]|uniref:Ig-like domain-containing protein n=1 Tax=uncultured Treponema sp. TaxID=162155 RepID=UPI0025FDA7C5|nr:Ig-like domain-containing protein [uncultured Treponema sp.]